MNNTLAYLSLDLMKRNMGKGNAGIRTVSRGISTTSHGYEWQKHAGTQFGRFVLKMQKCRESYQSRFFVQQVNGNECRMSELESDDR